MDQKPSKGTGTGLLPDIDVNDSPDARRDGEREADRRRGDLLKAGRLDPRLTQEREGTGKADIAQGLESILAEDPDRQKEDDDSATAI